MMKPELTVRLRAIIAAVLPAVLGLGCATAPATDHAASTSDSVAEFPVERTATLWVKGMGCPY